MFSSWAPLQKAVHIDSDLDHGPSPSIKPRLRLGAKARPCLHAGRCYAGDRTHSHSDRGPWPLLDRADMYLGCGPRPSKEPRPRCKRKGCPTYTPETLGGGLLGPRRLVLGLWALVSTQTGTQIVGPGLPREATRPATACTPETLRMGLLGPYLDHGPWLSSDCTDLYACCGPRPAPVFTSQMLHHTLILGLWTLAVL